MEGLLSTGPTPSSFYLGGVAPLVADLPQFKITTRQNPTINIYINVTFKSNMLFFISFRIFFVQISCIILSFLSFCGSDLITTLIVEQPLAKIRASPRISILVERRRQILLNQARQCNGLPMTSPWSAYENI